MGTIESHCAYVNFRHYEATGPLDAEPPPKRERHGKVKKEPHQCRKRRKSFQPRRPFLHERVGNLNFRHTRVRNRRVRFESFLEWSENRILAKPVLEGGTGSGTFKVQIWVTLGFKIQTHPSVTPSATSK